MGLGGQCSIVGMIFAMTGLEAQQPEALGAASGSINVFLDCQTFGCDFDFFRTEVAFVNWVRDRESSHVHLQRERSVRRIHRSWRR